MKYEFAIQKDILNSEEVIHTPVFRIKSRFNFFNYRWQRIAKVENGYELLELNPPPSLTEEDCKVRIEGYKAYLKDCVKTQVKTTELVLIEQGEEETLKQKIYSLFSF